MKIKIVIFFALVSCFRVFADCESDKQQLLDWTYDINGSISNLRDESLTVSRIAGSLGNGTLATSASRIAESATSIHTYNNMIRGYAKTIDCSNDTCSVDLGPLAVVCSNIYDVVSSEYFIISNCFDSIEFIRVNTESINSILGNVTDIDGGYFNVQDDNLYGYFASLTNQLALFQFDSKAYFGSVTNSLTAIKNLLTSINMVSLQNYQNISEISRNLSSIYSFLIDINNSLSSIDHYIGLISDSVYQYLPYLQTISQLCPNLLNTHNHHDQIGRASCRARG